MKTKNAFTLIELLVVIAIIGIIATLVLNMNSSAQTQKRNASVNADKAKLMMAIEQYQSLLNFFPPDNGNLVNINLTFAQYDGLASTNPLLYELSGATNFPNGSAALQLFNTPNLAAEADYNGLFNRQTVANANILEPHPFYIPPPKEYGPYTAASGSTNICGLLVPVASPNPAIPNFWHYDSSTTNRHNLGTYDLWAEYVVGAKGGSNIVSTNGNW